MIALLSSLGCKPKPGAPAVPPELPAIGWKFKDCNVVFVSFDALQASRVGTSSYPRNVTPTFDGMAKNAHCFTRAYSVASWTVPASMTWFTGVYPSEHRMTNKFAVYNANLQKPANLKELSPDLVTLAEILKGNGYATAAFTGNAGVSPGFGYEQGFDTYFAEKNRFGGFERSIPKALDWLAANKEKKFFLFLHGYDAHGQYDLTQGYDRRFVDPQYDGKYLGTTLEQETLREEGLERGRLTMRDEDVRFWRALYDEKVQRGDAHFAHFLDEFTKLGLNDKTLFVLTSDHGTELYEHRRFDHGFTLYDEQIRVPLAIKLPRQTAGAIHTDRISSIDIMPTILDLVDSAVPTKAQALLRGSSLTPTMQGTPANRDLFSETNYRAYTYKRSIVTPDGWKLIHTLERPSRELYDLNADPGETNDLAAKEPLRADELERRLFAHFKKIGHDLTAERWIVGLNPVYSSQGAGGPKK